MKLDNHASIESVSFQCLADAYSGIVLKVNINRLNAVIVTYIEIKPTNDNDNES